MAILLGSLSGGMQPSAPTIGTATAGDTTASVAFTASSYIGKGTITYTATSSPGGFTGTSASSPITVSGLSNGTAYTFTVVGNTNYGVASVASAASNSITPAAQGDYESIATTTLSSASSAITFSSIPSTYKHLQIRGIARTSRAVTNGDYVTTQFNGDSTNGNYIYGHELFANTTSGPISYYNGVGSHNIYERINSANQLSNYFSSVVIDILDYANTNKFKVNRGYCGYSFIATGSGDAEVHFNSSVWKSTNAISSITIAPGIGPNFLTYTQFALYGIKG